MKPVRVLIVDDSALVRKLLTRILHGDPGIEVVGTAPDPYVARQKIKQLEPDVLTLDIEMPRMDGITFLQKLMELHPMPVVMISVLTEKGADVTFEAMKLGAVDFVSKPTTEVAENLDRYAEEIISKIKNAACARVRALPRKAPGSSGLRQPPPDQQRIKPALLSRAYQSGSVIVIGASTGGTEAIGRVLSALPEDCPGIAVTQHIPATFSGPFARHLNDICALAVCEARDGQPILPGHAYIAPGGKHLMVVKRAGGYECRLHDGEPVNRHKPSVDILFMSALKAAGKNAIGVLLTGMGNDGAAGLLAMREAGAQTLVQDEETSVVWGMPGSAVKMGAAEHILPLDQIPEFMLQLAQRRGNAAGRSVAG